MDDSPQPSPHSGPVLESLARPAALLAWAIVSLVICYYLFGVTTIRVETLTTFPPSIATLFGTVVFDCVLLLSAFWHFKLSAPPGRDIKNEFGFCRIRCWRLLIVLAALVVIIDGTWWGVLRPLFPWARKMLALQRTIALFGPEAQVGWFVVIALLTPVAEEVFFRGWLWAALRRFCPPLAVMLITGLLWVLPHELEGLDAMLLLLPLAVFICVARHFCRSVSATIGLHALNNACVCIAILIYGSG